MKSLILITTLLLSTSSFAKENNLLVENFKIKDTTYIGYADTHSDFGHTMALNKASRFASKEIYKSCRKNNSKKDCAKNNMDKVFKKISSIYSTECGGSLFQGCYFSNGYIIKKKQNDDLIKNIIIKKDLISYSQERKCNSYSNYAGKRKADVLLSFKYKTTFMAVLNPIFLSTSDDINKTIDESDHGFFRGPYIADYESKIEDSEVEILMNSHRFGSTEVEESLGLTDKELCQIAYDNALKSVLDAANYEESEGDLHKYIIFK